MRAQLLGDQLGHLARRAGGRLGQPQGDVGGVVAVIGVLGTLDDDVVGNGHAERTAVDDGCHGGPDDVSQLLGCHRTSVLRTPTRPDRARRCAVLLGRAPRERPASEPRLGAGPGPRTELGTTEQPFEGEALAKEGTPGNRGKNAPARGGSSAAGKGASTARTGTGGRGRTRPPTQVVTQPRRPWGLIAAAIAVVLFAVLAIGYAVVKANESEANEVNDPDDIADIQTYDYAAGQTHVAEPVPYSESPPVGGPHAPPPDWADCTGTVYDVDIRHENAVHSLEHGAVWITYNPDEVFDTDIETLAALVDRSGRMMSPYEGQDSPISIQSWNYQLKVDSAADPRLKQYADFFTYNAEYYPEPGASCENPTFIESPLLEAQDGQAPADGSAPAESSAPATESTEPSESAEATSTDAQ